MTHAFRRAEGYEEACSECGQWERAVVHTAPPAETRTTTGQAIVYVLAIIGALCVLAFIANAAVH